MGLSLRNRPDQSDMKASVRISGVAIPVKLGKIKYGPPDI
jgi:hypothetical protein